MVAKVIPEERVCPGCGGTFLVGGEGNKKRSTITCSWPCRDKFRKGTRGVGKRCAQLYVTDAAYLAGVIDSDGSIGLYNSNGRLNRVTVSIASTDFDFLMWVKQVTGVGGVNRGRAATDKWKAGFAWVCTSYAGVSLLTQMLPYMHTKRERAELAIEYQALLETPEGRMDLAAQEKFRARMAEMTKRGPVNDKLETEPPAGWAH